ncbi:MAG: 16S rRNA (uracil(1498)-N(3))-methyltransferase [Chitinophagaceae bacterium]|nr:16S rRNA (uracil(1498)-N(3))-methyltransferase [Chitinophagaceae bacterium]
MQLPFFYIDPSSAGSPQVLLDEDNSRHAIQVLRMRNGEQMNLTDGKGLLLRVEIADDHKKHCQVSVLESELQERKGRDLTMAISLLKNNARFEWFLEKATELGVRKIVPLLCERTEKQKFRLDRMKGILISAMLQSQQCWLPELLEPIRFEEMESWSSQVENKFIAHCMPEYRFSLSKLPAVEKGLIAIGPEGDFSHKEIQLAVEKNFTPVLLGDNRLRTETAGMVAAALFLLKG